VNSAHRDDGERPGANRGIPALRWINRHIPVAEVGRALDLRFDGSTKIHCWKPEQHKNGDRTASVGIRRKNNTVKCFGCDSKPLGPVDLVMNVLGLNGPADAAVWIAERFSVPCIPKGKHLKQPARPLVRAGFEGDIGILVLSGLWAELSAPARCIVPVLLSHADREPGKDTAEVRISYRAISRYSGVASPNAVAEALGQLEEIGWLKRQEDPQRAPNRLRAVNTYLLAPQADSDIELAEAQWKQTREAIEGEREIRRRRRAERQTALHKSAQYDGAFPRTDCTKYKPLYSSNSASEIAAIRRIAVNWLSGSKPVCRHSRRRRRDALLDRRRPNRCHRERRVSDLSAQRPRGRFEMTKAARLGRHFETAPAPGPRHCLRTRQAPADCPTCGATGRYHQAHADAPGRDGLREVLPVLCRRDRFYESYQKRIVD